MLLVQPAATPWSETYAATADAIATAAIASPLPGLGSEAVERTAAVMVAVALFESHFQQDAEGDCVDKRPDGMCKRGARARSFCAFQINESNFAALGTTRAQIQSDINTCAAAALRMMHVSFGVCRTRPLEERLGHYASGGSTCGGLAASRARMGKALWIVRKSPPVVAD
jgi:hypothetical protein